MKDTTKEEVSRRKCTVLFTVLLTALVLYQSFAVWLFETVQTNPCNISDFSWNLLPWSSKFPYSELVVGSFHLLVIPLLSPLISMLIWNRLVSDVFRIRTITYAEAYTAFLGITLITGLFN